MVIKALPDPEPKAGHVLIAVKAFGVNHAETHMRKGEWAEAAEVSGIECVGEVVAAPAGEFQPGDKVAAFMGGMGRTIKGSYAERTLVPATNVMKITTDLSWEEFAVVPESYATIQRVARKYLHPDQVVILAVGDVDTILRGNPDRPQYSLAKFAGDRGVTRIPPA